MVLGPVVADRDLSGGEFVGGDRRRAVGGSAGRRVVALRWHPARPLLVATIAVFGNALPIAALALGLPLALRSSSAALINGVGMELFGVYWYTALHEHVAPEALSRVSSYDALGSLRDLAARSGRRRAVVRRHRRRRHALDWRALIVVPTALVLLVPEVRGLRSRAGEPSRVAEAIA